MIAVFIGLGLLGILLFAIPSSVPAGSDADPRNGIEWHVTVDGKTPGVDYSDTFDVALLFGVGTLFALFHSSRVTVTDGAVAGADRPRRERSGLAACALRRAVTRVYIPRARQGAPVSAGRTAST